MKVLIVDDDIATVEVIRDTVKWDMLGVDKVFTAYNISNAKIILKEEEGTDIVISDIEMPQGNGLELLRWVREQEINCEFLFLTCHENFDYASNAISYNAAAYLTKPFDTDVMEFTLKKLILKIIKNHEIMKKSQYGEWLSKNSRLLKLDFWTSVLNGPLAGDRQTIEEAIKNRKLSVSPDEKYYLIVTKLTNYEQEKEKYGEGLFEFVLQGLHSEILNNQVQNESVIKYIDGSNYFLLTVCTQQEKGRAEENCRRLGHTLSRHFKSTITCCISKLYPLEELGSSRMKIIQLVKQNIAFYGQVFTEEEAIENTAENSQIMDLDKITKLLADRDKNKILNYHKTLYEEIAGIKKLNEHVLYLVKQEMLQVVYAHLLKRGIHATRLFHDEISIGLSEKASQSTMDMMRWINYLLERTFQYEEEVQKSHTIIEKIHEYIHSHYKEEIGRNEIAAVFFLAPEYLAKLYKRKTGVYLNDYINEYRIEQAKLLLRKDDTRISDIAEAVGFDNFSYFSTLFKKLTGQTPVEYRKLEKSTKRSQNQ